MPSGNVISDLTHAISRALAKREPSPTTGRHRWQTEILEATLEILARDGYGDDIQSIRDHFVAICNRDLQEEIKGMEVRCHVIPGDLDQRTRDDMWENELSDERLQSMTPDEAFDDWCNFEGLVNYGPKLRRIYTDLLDSAI